MAHLWKISDIWSSMYEILTGTILISLLHAFIPSHWLPLVTYAKMQNWSKSETMRTCFYMALSHVLSTVVLGFILGKCFSYFKTDYSGILFWIGPGVLIGSGLYFIYRHHTHHHFHIDDHMLDQTRSHKQIIYALLAYMFLSPCLEIEAYFLNAGLFGDGLLIACILSYSVLSIGGMVCWVYLALQGLQRLDAHKWEHNAGIITGVIMVITGILALFI